MFSELLQQLLLALLPNEPVYYIGGSDVLPPPLPRSAEEAAINALCAGDRKAEQTLIEHNLRLVVYIARRFENTGVGLEDLISIGTIGLIKAVNTFDLDKGGRLVTYAARCIENELLMMLRQEKKILREVSLYEPIGTDQEGNHISLLDIISTDEAALVDQYLHKYYLSHLEQEVFLLEDSRERTIILKRYGLCGNKPHTQKEVAAMMGISRSYVSRIEKKALEKLRNSYEEYM